VVNNNNNNNNCFEWKRNHIFKEWFSFYRLVCCMKKNFPICGWYNKIQWRYGWKCPHFMYIVALVLHSCYTRVTLVLPQQLNGLDVYFSNTHSCMALAKWLPGFDEKSLAFEVLLAKCAIETLTVIIIIKSLDPSISSFNRESTGYTFCGK